MQITKAVIENFRALQSIKCPLRQFSVIIGENDAGKTSFFYALHAFFEAKKIDNDQNWYQQDTSKPIKITLSFTDIPQGIGGKFLRKDGNMIIEGVFERDSSPRYSSILEANEAVTIPLKVMREHFSLDHVVFVPVQRDISAQFSMNKTALFGKLVRAKMKKAIAEGGRQPTIDEIERFLRESMEDGRRQIEQFLRGQMKNQSIGLKFDDFHVNFIDGVNTEIRISDEKAQDIPLKNRGAGTQNNAIISLFRYIAESDIKKDFIFLLEEPENSLHPKAQRQLLSVIQDISESTQVLVTTHSPVFIDRSNYESNILFTRTAGGNTKAKVFSENAPHDVREELGIKTSDVLLKGGGNCALLVEGKTEHEGFPVFMEMMGINEFDLGVTIIDMEGKSAKKARTIARLLGSYDIPCIIVLDNDASDTKKDLDRERAQEDSALGNIQEIFLLSEGCIEDYYPLDVIVAVINEHLNPDKPVKKEDLDGSLRGKKKLGQIGRLLHEHKAATLEYLKISLGSHGTKMMHRKKMSVPDDIKKILSKLEEVASNQPAGE